jgi:hypothetical protein
MGQSGNHLGRDFHGVMIAGNDEQIGTAMKAK